MNKLDQARSYYKRQNYKEARRLFDLEHFLFSFQLSIFDSIAEKRDESAYV
jgi:hypothetical protein